MKKIFLCILFTSFLIFGYSQNYTIRVMVNPLYIGIGGGSLNVSEEFFLNDKVSLDFIKTVKRINKNAYGLIHILIFYIINTILNSGDIGIANFYYLGAAIGQ